MIFALPARNLIPFAGNRRHHRFVAKATQSPCLAAPIVATRPSLVGTNYFITRDTHCRGNAPQSREGERTSAGLIRFAI